MSFWFDTVLAPITITSNQELSLALGARTLVQLTGAATFTFFGLARVGGNVDGQVVTFVNVSNSGSVAYGFADESGSATSVNRFVNRASVTISIGANYGGITYRYSGQSSRWKLLARG